MAIMDWYFKISDFFRVWTGAWVYQKICSRELIEEITHHHFIPINRIREKVGFAIRVTGCYRPPSWEKKKGRSGTSQHCFDKESTYGDRHGATDLKPWYAHSTSSTDMVLLLEELIDSPFTRIAYYPDLKFFHVDYKFKGKNLYLQTSGGWVNASKKDIIKAIEKDFD